MTKIAASKFDTAEKRWAGVGPYYAMFPTAFAESVIMRYTSPGDVVLDPFVGRGTAVYAAATHERCGLGIEINPVSWVYGKAKLAAAAKVDVEARLAAVASLAPRYKHAAAELPEFFRHCFCKRVREFLLAARANLDWRYAKTDWTLMALLLVHLHGKRTDSLSNQMRQTKAMSPQYALEWWEDNGEKPPQIEPVKFMQGKMKWRYAKGVPTLHDAQVYLGDSIDRLASVEKVLPTYSNNRVKLLLTSPPYCGVTNYHYDQWIRLWLLGGSNSPTVPTGSHRGKFVDRVKYKRLLERVFKKTVPLLANRAVVYVRTDGRQLSRNITVDVLNSVFPKKRMFIRPKPRKHPTQTWLFDSTKRTEKDEGDTDIVLLP